MEELRKAVIDFGEWLEIEGTITRGGERLLYNEIRTRWKAVQDVLARTPAGSTPGQSECASGPENKVQQSVIRPYRAGEVPNPDHFRPCAPQPDPPAVPSDRVDVVVETQTIVPQPADNPPTGRMQFPCPFCREMVYLSPTQEIPASLKCGECKATLIVKFANVGSKPDRVAMTLTYVRAVDRREDGQPKKPARFYRVRFICGNCRKLNAWGVVEREAGAGEQAQVNCPRCGVNYRIDFRRERRNGNAEPVTDFVGYAVQWVDTRYKEKSDGERRYYVGGVGNERWKTFPAEGLDIEIFRDKAGPYGPIETLAREMGEGVKEDDGIDVFPVTLEWLEENGLTGHYRCGERQSDCPDHCEGYDCPQRPKGARFPVKCWECGKDFLHTRGNQGIREGDRSDSCPECRDAYQDFLSDPEP